MTQKLGQKTQTALSILRFNNFKAAENYNRPPAKKKNQNLRIIHGNLVQFTTIALYVFKFIFVRS